MGSSHPTAIAVPGFGVLARVGRAEIVLRVEDARALAAAFLAAADDAEARATTDRPAEYYLVSVKHTQRRHDWVTLWRPNGAGYAWPLEWSGLYAEKVIREGLYRYNSGGACLAVRAGVVEALAVWSKIDGQAVRCVPNRRAVWNALIAGAIEPPEYEVRAEYPGAPRCRR